MKDSGEIKLSEGRKFKWLLTGTTVPEIYGWVESAEGRILPDSCGYFRTTDPEAAVKHVEHVGRTEYEPEPGEEEKFL